MLNRLLFIVTLKLAVLGVASLTAVGGFLATNAVSHSPSAQTAIIVNAAQGAKPASSTASSTITTPSSTLTLPAIPPGLLPTTTIPFCTASSTCGEKGLQKLFRTNIKVVAKKPTPGKTTARTIAITTTAATPTPAPASTTTTAAEITATSFLTNTTLSFKTLFTGSDELIFTTNLGNHEPPLTWGLLTTTLGGTQADGSTGSFPKFSVTASCAPLPNQPSPGDPDQTPSFNVRTPYNCTVSLTPQSGADQRTQTKDFLFTTPPGDFIVMPDTAMNSTLVNNANNGGIILENQDSNPITVTGITFNASYAYLNTLSNIPLILRFQDPTTGTSLADYSLTNASSETGITLPLSLTIPPLSQKFLPIQVLGVQKMLVLNTTPSINITITGMTIDRSDVKVILHNPTIAWNCMVTSQSYDPNATSGAYVSGQACLQ